MLKHSTIFLTGIPRSGTTLVSFLLGKQRNTVSLNEPLDFAFLQNSPYKSINNNRRVALSTIEEFISCTVSLMEKHVAPLSKGFMGQPSSQMFEEYISSSVKLRKNIHTLSAIDISNIQQTEILVIKHPAAFSALLPELLNAKFCVFAIIRNPIQVLASWETCDMPVHYGRSPVAEKLDSKLKEDLLEKEDRLSKQIVLLRWYYNQYIKYLGHEQIIKYEEILLSRGAILNKIIDSFDHNSISNFISGDTKYPSIITKQIAKRLLYLEESDAIFKFYSFHSILNEI